MESLSVCVYQWNTGYRDYRPEYVNVLARMVKRHLPMPHRFICVTDETKGFSADVEVMATPEAARTAGKVLSPEGPRFPSSYRRLWTFSEEARCLGDRVMLLDIDCAITGDLSPLFEPVDDFVGWRPTSAWGTTNRVAGGTWLLRTGTRTKVWTSFSARGVGKARTAGYRGSDQAWISYCLASNVAVWPKSCGIYQAQQMKVNRFEVLPDDARIVHFNGRVKSWDLLSIPWIRKSWAA